MAVSKLYVRRKFYLLFAVDALNMSRPGTSLGEPKGRMLRGQSVGEAAASDAVLLSQLASLQQLGGMGNAQPQAAIGHRKQLSGGGAGWPASGVVPGQNPVVYLQSLLQPKLQQRSRIQQDRMMTQQQKCQQMDTVNAEIDILKHQINLLQPAAAVPAMQGQVLNELLRSVALTNDAALAQQLLSQLKLDQGVTDADVKATLMDGMTGAAPEAWPAGLATPASRFQWQDSSSGVRQMPPPGLGQDSGDSTMWGRGSGWNPTSDKFKAAAAAAAAGELSCLYLQRSCCTVIFFLIFDILKFFSCNFVVVILCSLSFIFCLITCSFGDYFAIYF